MSVSDFIDGNDVVELGKGVMEGLRQHATNPTAASSVGGAAGQVAQNVIAAVAGGAGITGGLAAGGATVSGIAGASAAAAGAAAVAAAPIVIGAAAIGAGIFGFVKFCEWLDS